MKIKVALHAFENNEDNYFNTFKEVEVEIPDDGKEWHVCGEIPDNGKLQADNEITYNRCPFCGSTNIIIDGEESVYYTCEDCGAEGPWVDPKDNTESEYEIALEKARQLWNHRV